MIPSVTSTLVLCFLLFAGMVSLTRPRWLGGQSFSQLVWSRSGSWWLLVAVSVVTAGLLVQFDGRLGDAAVFGLWCFVMGHWFWRD